jgi:hypothetical protein
MELAQELITETAVKPVTDDLERKIRDRSAKLGVLGLGYVGLPLAVEMAQSGFSVTGIDIDGSKVKSVNAGISHAMESLSDKDEKELLTCMVASDIARRAQNTAISALSKFVAELWELRKGSHRMKAIRHNRLLLWRRAYEAAHRLHRPSVTGKARAL